MSTFSLAAISRSSSNRRPARPVAAGRRGLCGQSSSSPSSVPPGHTAPCRRTRISPITFRSAAPSTGCRASCGITARCRGTARSRPRPSRIRDVARQPGPLSTRRPRAPKHWPRESRRPARTADPTHLRGRTPELSLRPMRLPQRRNLLSRQMPPRKRLRSQNQPVKLLTRSNVHPDSRTVVVRLAHSRPASRIGPCSQRGCFTPRIDLTDRPGRRDLRRPGRVVST